MRYHFYVRPRAIGGPWSWGILRNQGDGFIVSGAGGSPPLGTMGSDGIVQPPPLLDEYRCLGQCVEDLSVQELVSQFAVEALVVAVLPRTARRDVEGLDPQPGQPSPHQFRRESWPVVRAQMLGRTVPSEEIGEHLENVVSSSEVPPVAVPLPMLDPEPSVVPGVGAS